MKPTLALVLTLSTIQVAHAQLPVPVLKLPANTVAQPAQATPAPSPQTIQPVRSTVMPAAATPAGIPLAIDPLEAELAKQKAYTRSLADQISGVLGQIHSAQAGQWRGQRSCQGPLVVWDKPAEAGGTSIPLTAYDCSPFLCEAPGYCMTQCNSSGQCAPGAQCIKTDRGGICAPAK